MFKQQSRISAIFGENIISLPLLFINVVNDIKGRDSYIERRFSERCVCHNLVTAAQVPPETTVIYKTIKEEITRAPRATAVFAGAWLMCIGEILFLRTSPSYERHCIHHEEYAKIRSKP